MPQARYEIGKIAHFVQSGYSRLNIRILKNILNFKRHNADTVSTTTRTGSSSAFHTPEGSKDEDVGRVSGESLGQVGEVGHRIVGAVESMHFMTG